MALGVIDGAKRVAEAVSDGAEEQGLNETV